MYMKSGHLLGLHHGCDLLHELHLVHGLLRRRHLVGLHLSLRLPKVLKVGSVVLQVVARDESGHDFPLGDVKTGQTDEHAVHGYILQRSVPKISEEQSPIFQII